MVAVAQSRLRKPGPRAFTRQRWANKRAAADRPHALAPLRTARVARLAKDSEVERKSGEDAFDVVGFNDHAIRISRGAANGDLPGRWDSGSDGADSRKVGAFGDV